MSTYGVNAAFTLLLCSGLNLVAFISSNILVKDPVLILERSLVTMEKTVNFACKGITLACRILDGLSLNGSLERENLKAFCGGLILFSLATSMLFTPMPVFLSQGLALSQSLIFALYALNSTGSVLGYFLACRNSGGSEEKSALKRIAISRSVLTFLLMVNVQPFALRVLLATAILTLMGFIYALFLVSTLALSMELLPEGKAGVFNALVGVGGAAGSFIGPFLAEKFGFTYVFLTSGIIFLFAYISFKIFN
ncbi:MAG: hypothetical protein QXQ41_00475 [Candidatus Bathyarchaeia archaeon]